ncbi:MAG: purine-nucleoside phosphorylase [Bacteroidetes bacterium]|nr:purine-nucleoside phosphorylase [Bacteroidota bacterium]
MLSKISEAVKFLKQQDFRNAEAGIVLGTGLNSFIQQMRVEKAVAYKDIPHFPMATVEFHKGQLIFGWVGEKKVIAMLGRFHYYEGYDMQEITFPIRVLKELGIQYLLLSNAAGGINKIYKKGDLVLIDDHINLLPSNPLRGLSDPAFGNRFVDMSEPYDQKLGNLISQSAISFFEVLKHGVYASVSGPNLETRAEYRYLQRIGADLVGMSTVPEVIVANQMKLPCAAVSVVTDECDPDHLQPVDISEIIAVAEQADKKLSRIFEKVIFDYQG